MACCDWETFYDGFVNTWSKAKAGDALIDWRRARRNWSRNHCTGGEAASMQLRALKLEGEYLFSTGRGKRNGGGDGGAPIIPNRPKPVPA